MAMLAALGQWACTPETPQAVMAMDVSQAGYGKDFRLQDTSGRWRTLADFRGKTVLVFFGFTQCPDICPAAMNDAAEVIRQLGADAARTQVIFISLDPERDTPDILQAFTSAFHPDFVALRGDVELTRQTAEAYRVYFRKVPQGSSYTIDHSAMVYLYDSEGRLQRALRPGMTPIQQAAEVRKFLPSA